MIIREEVKFIVPYDLPLVMGNEFSGVIEKIGSNVTEFKIGDKLYGRSLSIIFIIYISSLVQNRYKLIRF
jgi:NADPH:quinone reductase-like Zn-dependent oxidoreductase